VAAPDAELVAQALGGLGLRVADRDQLRLGDLGDRTGVAPGDRARADDGDPVRQRPVPFTARPPPP
jgi:hypothetical protein